MPTAARDLARPVSPHPYDFPAPCTETTPVQAADRLQTSRDLVIVVVILSPIAQNLSICVVFQDETIPHGPEGARPDRRPVFKHFLKCQNN